MGGDLTLRREDEEDHVKGFYDWNAGIVENGIGGHRLFVTAFAATSAIGNMSVIIMVVLTLPAGVTIFPFELGKK